MPSLSPASPLTSCNLSSTGKQIQVTVPEGGKLLVGVNGNQGSSRLDNIALIVQKGGLVNWARCVLTSVIACFA